MAETEDNKIQLLSREIMKWSEIIANQSIFSLFCCRDGCKRFVSRALQKAESELMDFTSFGTSLYNLAPKY